MLRFLKVLKCIGVVEEFGYCGDVFEVFWCLGGVELSWKC